MFVCPCCTTVPAYVLAGIHISESSIALPWQRYTSSRLSVFQTSRWHGTIPDVCINQGRAGSFKNRLIHEPYAFRICSHLVETANAGCHCLFNSALKNRCLALHRATSFYQTISYSGLDFRTVICHYQPLGHQAERVVRLQETLRALEFTANWPVESGQTVRDVLGGHALTSLFSQWIGEATTCRMATRQRVRRRQLPRWSGKIRAIRSLLFHSPWFISFSRGPTLA